MIHESCTVWKGPKKKDKKKHKHQSCARNHKQHFHTLPLCVDILGLKNLHKKPQQNDVKIFFPPTDRDFQVWTLSLQPSTLVVGSHFQVTTKVNSWKEDGNGKLSRGDLVAAVDTCRSVTSPVVLFVGCQGNEELCVTRFFFGPDEKVVQMLRGETCRVGWSTKQSNKSFPLRLCDFKNGDLSTARCNAFVGIASASKSSIVYFCLWYHY